MLHNPRMGNIILLNGSSSSGKTTLAEALQQRLPEPYQHVSLDQFRDGLPMRYRGLNSPSGTPGAEGLNIVPVEMDGARVTEIRFGAHGEAVLEAMRRTVALFSDKGLNVIVDDILFKPDYLHDYARVLPVERTWLVGVTCKLEVVESREASRVGRFPGTANSHFDSVHAHGTSYDIEVDTSERGALAIADEIIARLTTPPTALAHTRRELGLS